MGRLKINNDLRNDFYDVITRLNMIKEHHDDAYWTLLKELTIFLDCDVSTIYLFLYNRKGLYEHDFNVLQDRISFFLDSKEFDKMQEKHNAKLTIESRNFEIGKE